MTDTRTLEEQLAHCDGADCTCMAYDQSECACGADWTPAEVYRLRAAERGKWQPIETAPHDRDVLLIKGRSQFVGHWCQNVDTGAEAWSLGDAGIGVRVIAEGPSHWRELPELPK